MYFAEAVLQIEMPPCEMCSSAKEGAMKMMENLIWRKTSVYTGAQCVLHPEHSPSLSRPPRGCFQHRYSSASLCDWTKQKRSLSFWEALFSLLCCVCSGFVCWVWFSLVTQFQFGSLKQSINHRRNPHWNTTRYIFYAPEQPL